MVKSFKSINDAVMQEIYAYEEQKKLKFEQEFDALCAHISKKYGWTYTIQLYRWIDNFCRIKSKPFDGYTATVPRNDCSRTLRNNLFSIQIIRRTQCQDITKIV